MEPKEDIVATRHVSWRSGRYRTRCWSRSSRDDHRDPVWVGRKLHTRYGHLPQHKRNMVIAGGVTASVIVAPVVASLAVGIGVPILLAYVYGVVPISLCRSGGCGVSTTNSGRSSI
ncbi:E3 ubiquitin-protein ligase RNF19B-like isoform X1 [Tubulanus polymorphus]|uniref:E3 ubiquitin-protein ligase RNF19B-like isoform X1 n=1 Tax=Tubulanus polymorphus TaxID=672921 RepID=UPI003DA47741